MDQVVGRWVWVWRWQRESRNPWTEHLREEPQTWDRETPVERLGTTLAETPSI